MRKPGRKTPLKEHEAYDLSHAFDYAVSLLARRDYSTHELKKKLAERGYTLARALGLLVWGYVFWLFASFGIAQNDAGGLLLALLVLVGLSGWAYWRDSGKWKADPASSIFEWVRRHYKTILVTEA